MKIDIIIPNFNGSHLIKKNIPYVLESVKDFDSEIIIVDDGSNKDDVVSLRELVNDLNSPRQRIKLLEHRVNKGFSSAINTGVKNSKADIVVLLNSDVLPERNFLKSPINNLSNNELIFGIGCMDESMEGDKKVLRGVGNGKWVKGMVLHSEGDINSENTFWISGGSSIIRRETFLKLGGLDELYNPFYWEDIDLSYRAQKAGFKILFDKNSVVKHFHEEGSILSNFKRKQIKKIAYRNQFIFIWKNISDKGLVFQHLLFLPINILNSIRSRDLEFLQGLFLAILKLPAIIKKRNFQKKFYMISDKLLLGLKN